MVTPPHREEVTQQEIDKLVDDQRKTYIPAGDQIIDVNSAGVYGRQHFQTLLIPLDMAVLRSGPTFISSPAIRMPFETSTAV
jgi:cell division protein FtsA